MKSRIFCFVVCCLLVLDVFVTDIFGGDIFRLGIIGTTTSHVPAFVKILNDPNASEPCNGFKVVAAYPGGMPDNAGSWNRVKQFADELEKQGIQLHNTVESMLPNVDGVLLESVDGRPHLEQAKPVINAGKPLFIDKPMAASLADVLTIFRLAKEKKVPVFSASSLRFASGFQKVRKGESSVGKVIGCDVWCPCSLNDKHPDLFWYGIHGVEILFTLMETGCESVTRIQTEGTELVTGTWKGGRIGTFRGIRTGKAEYGAIVFGDKGIANAGSSEGYKPLVEEIARFFKTGQLPIDPQETIEIIAFMEAAEQSKIKGASVSIDQVIREAENKKIITVQLNMSANTTLTLNNQPLKIEELAKTLDNFVAEKPDHEVKVILSSEKGTPIESVQSVCNNLGNATLANYIYNYR
ncbi:MAG: Gfo/Idh/MocA family oxidoreductase [Planctomycetaceae bacterium]|jgi:predicted dehydrogenase|nr:Gfo/Idh/MocA family oxidoreductase [Planctomycetaceae bacterium]